MEDFNAAVKRIDARLTEINHKNRYGQIDDVPFVEEVYQQGTILANMATEKLREINDARINKAVPGLIKLFKRLFCRHSKYVNLVHTWNGYGYDTTKRCNVCGKVFK